MTSFQLKSRVAVDGSLDLHVPTGLPEAEVEAPVALQPVRNGAGAASPDAKSPEELGWPSGFFEETAGRWQGEPICTNK